MRIVSARATRSPPRVQAERRTTQRLSRGEKNCEPKALSGRSSGPLLAQNARIGANRFAKTAVAAARGACSTRCARAPRAAF
jgi:hypothetical protein